MVTKDQVIQLRANLQRIFALKISRTTFRETQNAILAAVQGDTEAANKVFEALLKGEVGKVADKDGTPILQGLIDDFCIAMRLSKDVYERGEFLQVITSDRASSQQQSLFVNRIRRIDGNEFQFVSDVDSTLSLLQHFVGRLNELGDGEGENPLSEKKDQLKAINTGLQGLLK